MAFSKTPTQDTYDTKRFPLVGMPMQRDGQQFLKDQRLLNCYAEQIKAQVTEAKKYFVKKRWGLNSRFNPNNGAARGMIFEPNTGKLFYVVGSNCYVWDGVSNILLNPSIPGTGSVGFTTHLTTTVSVILATGTTGYVIDPAINTISTITDPDFPNPHLPFPVSMDGYLFLVKANSADIYNSDLNDPFSWTPGGFITAEMYPDYVTCLAKSNNYVVAVGNGSMESFYDLGSASGSPLQRNESAVQQFGTPAPETVVQSDDEMFLLGSTSSGGFTVWSIKGFDATEIGTEAIRNALSDVGENIGQANAYTVRVDGHKFYVLRITPINRTFVYDTDSKLWHEWSTSSGANQVIFSGKYACDSDLGYPYMLSDGLVGVIMTMDPSVYTDAGTPIKMQFTTLKLDFDNMNRKICSRLSVYGDWPLNTSSTLMVEWSDDDYRTWSTPRPLQLSAQYSWLRRCGRFRRRALRFTHTDPVPVRLEGCEMDLDQGVS